MVDAVTVVKFVSERIHKNKKKWKLRKFIENLKFERFTNIEIKNKILENLKISIN